MSRTAGDSGETKLISRDIKITGRDIDIVCEDIRLGDGEGKNPYLETEKVNNPTNSYANTLKIPKNRRAHGYPRLSRLNIYPRLLHTAWIFP